MLCSHPLDYPSDGWLTELTILAKPSSLVLPIDYPKRRSAWQQRFAIAISPNPPAKPDPTWSPHLSRTGDRYRASSHEIELQAFDHRILHATLSRGSQLIKSGSRLTTDN